MAKDYIGDGIYATDNGPELILTTENGVSVSNEIYFGPHEQKALVRFMAKAHGTDPDVAVKAVLGS